VTPGARRAIVVTRHLLALVALVIGGWALTHAAVSGVRRTAKNFAPSTLRQERATFGFFNCVETQIRSVVHSGDAVFVDAKDDATFQRLTELATPWAHLVTDRSRARLIISLRPYTGRGSCGGNAVMVVRQ
jgi:hypothetical protein